MNIFSDLKRQVQGWLQLPAASPAPGPGIYHFKREENGERMAVHLRIEPDGKAIVLVNASRIFHLNSSAAFMAYLFLRQASMAEAETALQQTFQVSRTTASKDYAQFSASFSSLLKPDGPCAICDLQVDTIAPFSDRPSAPYRMDLAITYRCNNNCAHCYNARPRNFSELPQDQWQEIIDRLWDAGIPHVVFTGGEPTLREDLPELIAYAQKTGMVTGLNTNGRWLKDPAYVDKLIQSGLDHVQITLESHIPEIHDEMVACRGAWQDTTAGLKNALASHLYVMTNTTLLRANSSHLNGLLTYLEQTGVLTFGLNALIYSGRGKTVGTGLAENELPFLLDLAREHVSRTGQRLIWYTPTQYCNFDPMQLELGVKGCTAALYNMCIEPNGAVIPCQSYYEPVGNLLKEEWTNIWNHPLSIRLRERENLPDKCTSCALVAECGGGCPLARDIL